MAEGTGSPLEERLRRRIVHIDRKGVGEEELHLAQRILMTRRLHEAEGEIFRIAVVRPVHIPAADPSGIPAPPAVDTDPLFAHRTGVPQQLGDHLLLDDALWHIPVGVEHDRLHDIGEDRRGVFPFADHHLHLTLHCAAVLDRKHECRDIDHDVAGRTAGDQPLDAVEVETEGIDTLLQRHIERLHRLRADHPVTLQAVARLERLHRGLHAAVIARTLLRAPGIVPQQPQPFTDQREALLLCAPFDHAGVGDRRPLSFLLQLQVRDQLLLERVVAVAFGLRTRKGILQAPLQYRLLQQRHRVCLRLVGNPPCMDPLPLEVVQLRTEGTPIDTPVERILRITAVEP